MITPRDELIEIYMRLRMNTSTRDTTGAAMAIRAADLLIAECGSAEVALVVVRELNRASEPSKPSYGTDPTWPGPMSGED